MMPDIGRAVVALFCGAMFLAALSVVTAIGWISTATSTPDREAEAIQRGYALHCPQTGDFAWKGECDD